MNSKQFENFIFNKGRDLEVSLFNYHFLSDPQENCLLALSLYINDDGGISNINPNNLNNISSLSACIYFLDIIFDLNYNNTEEWFNDIINDVIKYLKKQHKFSYYHKSNDNKPCSNLFKEDKYYFHLEAITYAYIYKYTTDNSYKVKLEKIVNEFIDSDSIEFIDLYYFKKIESMINNEKLKEKIINVTKEFFTHNNLYKLIFNSDDYLLNTYKEEFNIHKDYLLYSRNSIGLWEEELNWSDIYPEAEVASIKYISIKLIDVLKFLKNVGVENV